MHVDTALDLIHDVVYKPGWCLKAEDHRNRFEEAVKVKITYPCRSLNREEAPDYAKEIEAYASFVIQVGGLEDDCALYHRLLELFIDIETHEAREALRVRPTMWAPFHPHREDGMRRWGTPE